MRLVCANCGGEMTRAPVNQQRTRWREVTMQWACCPSCLHMALAAWSWTDPEPESQSDETVYRDKMYEGQLVEEAAPLSR
jgi:hypothetical protein